MTNLLDILKENYNKKDDQVLLRKLESNALEYSRKANIQKVEYDEDGKVIQLIVFIPGKHDEHIVVWQSNNQSPKWKCDCDLFNGREQFSRPEGPRGECSHTMAVRLLADRRGWKHIQLPSEDGEQNSTNGQS